MALFGDRIRSAMDMLEHYLPKHIPAIPATIGSSEQRFLLTCDQRLLQQWAEEFVTQIDEIKNARSAYHVANNQFAGQAKQAHEDAFVQVVAPADVTQFLRQAGTKLNDIRTAKDKIDRLLMAPANGHGRRQVMLPQLSLKSFDGTPGTWDEFWPLFVTTVDSDNDLDGVQKMSYLDAQLKGGAKKCIQGLFPYSDANYKLAIDILKDKYGKNENLIRDLHNKLARLPRSSSLEDDFKMQVEVELLCRQLEHYKQNLDSPQVYLNLEQKLSDKVLGKYVDLKTSHASVGAWTTTLFRETYKRSVEHLKQIKDIQTRSGQDKGHESRRRSKEQNERQSPEPLSSTMNLAVRYKGIPASRSPKREQSPQQRPMKTRSRSPDKGAKSPTREGRSPNRRGSPWPNEARFQAGKTNTERTPSTSRSRSPARFPCPFCQRIHFAIDCDQYRTADKRKNAIKEKELCYVCLRKGHLAKDCFKYSQKCFLCKRPKHHPAICEKRYAVKKEQFTAMTTRTKQEFDSSDSDSQTASTVASGCLKKQSEVHSLLKCIRVTVYNPMNPNKHRRCTLGFLDDGSEKSYAKSTLLEDLNIEALSNVNINISGIGGKEIGTYKSGVFEIGLKGKDMDMLMKVRSMDRVLNKVPHIEFSNKEVERLLTNKVRVKPILEEPELLIGGDYYNYLNIRPVEQLANGFWISSSKLGMLISGEGKIEGFNKKQALAEACNFVHTRSLAGQVIEIARAETT